MRQCIATLLAPFAALVLAVPSAPAEIFTPEDDTYGRHSPYEDDVYGSEDEIVVKYSTDYLNTTRKAVIEFDISILPFDVVDATEVTLYLDVSTYDGTGASDSSTFHVSGVTDGATIEDFEEATANYNFFEPPFDDFGGDGLDNKHDYFHGGQSFGTFDVSADDLGDTVSFTSDKLLEWIKADTNGTATIMLTRATDHGAINSAFAPKEHDETLNPPRLQIVPEPSGVILLLSGVIGLAFFGARYRADAPIRLAWKEKTRRTAIKNRRR